MGLEVIKIPPPTWSEIIKGGVLVLGGIVSGLALIWTISGDVARRQDIIQLQAQVSGVSGRVDQIYALLAGNSQHAAKNATPAPPAVRLGGSTIAPDSMAAAITYALAETRLLP